MSLSFSGQVIRMNPKVVIHINGFYLPCPTMKQKTQTNDLIDHVGKGSAAGFSVNMISPGTSANQHCDFASPMEKEGSLSSVLYVNLVNGVAPNYTEIQSLHEKVVVLTTDYYESTKNIVRSNQVWGKHFISGLDPYRHLENPLDAYIQDKIESEEVIPVDGGGWQCKKNCCLFPENMRTSWEGTKRAEHDTKHNTPSIWSEVPNHLGGAKKFYCSKCPGALGAGMIDCVKAPRSKKTLWVHITLSSVNT